MFPEPDNYYLVPVAGSNYQRARLYTLGEAGTFQHNALVLVPYTNPQKKEPRAHYYPVLNVEEVNMPEASGPGHHLQLQARTSRQRYLQQVDTLKRHIQLGNIYEINYCIEFYAENAIISPLHTFAALCHISKAPYCALLKTGSTYIVCGSPELFLQKEGSRVWSKPIKGTIRRGSTPQEDETLKHTLFHSLKERTENVMAVDVARNDLSHFAQKGSVHVNKLYNIESFETVHQMVSTVSCDVREGVDFEQMLKATFPMASMTGAPKLRAMQLADEFEDFERGPYSGAMGLIAPNGDFELCVIIRSIFYNRDTRHLSVAVGGAITYLCDPEKEYEEALLKAQGMMRALGTS